MPIDLRILGYSKNDENWNGNIREYKFKNENWGEMDVFYKPKEFVHSLLSIGGKSPRDFIGANVPDHGYSTSVVHDNYLFASKNTPYELIADLYSSADIMDDSLYRGNWSLLPYYCQQAIIEPAIYINNSINPSEIRPGSSWTKYNNYKSRSNKLHDIYNSCHHSAKPTIDTLCTMFQFIQYLPIDDIVALLQSYNIKAAHLDTINHISMKTSIKPKLVNIIKRKLNKNEVAK